MGMAWEVDLCRCQLGNCIVFRAIASRHSFCFANIIAQICSVCLNFGIGLVGRG